MSEDKLNKVPGPEVSEEQVYPNLAKEWACLNKRVGVSYQKSGRV